MLVRLIRILEEKDKQFIGEQLGPYLKKGTDKYIYGLKANQLPHELEKLGKVYYRVFEWMGKKEQYHDKQEFQTSVNSLNSNKDTQDRICNFALKLTRKNKIMPEGLQLIIGADNKNEFTVYKNPKDNKIYVYFGIGLFEVVENNKHNPELKLLLARLYNSGVKVKTLIEHFGFSYPTYKHWGDALKSGDEERIYYALSGQGGGSKKLKPDIVAFIIHDFSHVYPRNQYSYSKEIREDIKNIYNLELSAECIRPLLGKLKKSYSKNQGLSEVEKKSIYKSYLN